VLRNQQDSKWRSKAAIYLAASTMAGGALGALLGSIGHLLSAELRISLGVFLGAVAFIVGVLDLAMRRIGLLQRDRETPQRWLDEGPTKWALRNGAMLGTGFGTRIGFWLWYAVPAASFLHGSWAAGALIYGSYAFVRAMWVWPILLWTGPRRGFVQTAEWLVRHRGAAKKLAAVQLVIVGAVGMLS
jgi:hypothetical protein